MYDTRILISSIKETMKQKMESFFRNILLNSYNTVPRASLEYQVGQPFLYPQRYRSK